MLLEVESEVVNEVDAAVRAGLFPDGKTVVREALSSLFANRPDLRLELALERFRNDEVSVSRAAEIAGIDFETFRDVLYERGIPEVIEGDSVEEMDKQIAEYFGKPQS